MIATARDGKIHAELDPAEADMLQDGLVLVAVQAADRRREGPEMEARLDRAREMTGVLHRAARAAKV